MISPTKRHIAGSSPVLLLLQPACSARSDNGSTTSHLIPVPHCNAAAVKSQAAAASSSTWRVSVTPEVCVSVFSPASSSSFFFFFGLRGIFLSLSFKASFSAARQRHLQKCGAPAGTHASLCCFSVGPPLEIDGEEGLN